jgi:hypothetical protein
MSIPANVKHDNKDIFTMSFLNAKEKSLVDPPNTKHSPFWKARKSHSDASRNQPTSQTTSRMQTDSDFLNLYTSQNHALTGQLNKSLNYAQNSRGNHELKGGNFPTVVHVGKASLRQPNLLNGPAKRQRPANGNNSSIFEISENYALAQKNKPKGDRRVNATKVDHAAY